jgi:hypothetical protein
MLQQCIPPQSRQSAKRFSSRWNWDSPTPLAAGECAQLYIVVYKRMCHLFLFTMGGIGQELLYLRQSLKILSHEMDLAFGDMQDQF